MSNFNVRFDDLAEAEPILRIAFESLKKQPYMGRFFASHRHFSNLSLHIENIGQRFRFSWTAILQPNPRLQEARPRDEYAIEAQITARLPRGVTLGGQRITVVASHISAIPENVDDMMNHLGIGFAAFQKRLYRASQSARLELSHYHNQDVAIDCLHRADGGEDWRFDLDQVIPIDQLGAPIVLWRKASGNRDATFTIRMTGQSIIVKRREGNINVSFDSVARFDRLLSNVLYRLVYNSPLADKLNKGTIMDKALSGLYKEHQITKTGRRFGERLSLDFGVSSAMTNEELLECLVHAGDRITRFNDSAYEIALAYLREIEVPENTINAAISYL